MHQILFTFSSAKIQIYSFGAMMVVAVLSAGMLASWRARRVGLDSEQVDDLGFWVILSGLVGARLFYVFEVWGKDEMKTVWDVIAIWRGGIVLYGSMLGAAAGFVIYRQFRDFPILPTLDAIAPSLALGMALGRIGCFLNGCCYGDRCSLPWAVRFPQRSIPWWNHVEHGWINLAAEKSVPIHPTQLYSAIDAFLLFFLLTAFFPLRRRDGQVVVLLMIAYSLSRFLIERLRDDDGIFLVGLTISQVISVAILACGIGLWAWLQSRPLGPLYAETVKGLRPE